MLSDNLGGYDQPLGGAGAGWGGRGADIALMDEMPVLGIDVQLVAQTVIYYSIILFGLLIAVPVGLTTVSHNFIFFWG